MNNQDFLSVIDRVTRRWNIVNQLVDWIAEKAVPQATASAGCPGYFCGSYTEICPPLCINGRVAYFRRSVLRYFVTSWCGDCNDYQDCYQYATGGSC